MDLAMLCNQCEMSAPGGCGSNGADKGTCGKDSTLARLQDMMIYGLKGLAAYRSQAHHLGADTSNVDTVTAESLYFTLTNVNFDFDAHIKQLMSIGSAGVEVMGLLGDAHHKKLGEPTPVSVSQNTAEGKAILVSGHDLFMLEKLLEQIDLPPEKVAYVGDDLPDLPVIRYVGFGVAVANAVDEVKRHADYVTTRPGGGGAVRELIEHILKGTDKWRKLMERYLP